MCRAGPSKSPGLPGRQPVEGPRRAGLAHRRSGPLSVAERHRQDAL